MAEILFRIDALQHASDASAQERDVDDTGMDLGLNDQDPGHVNAKLDECKWHGYDARFVLAVPLRTGVAT